MTTEVTHRAAMGRKVRLGIWVAVAMAVLTIIEYFVAINIERPLLWLIPLAAVKGWLILDYFMHFRAFLRDEDGH